MAFSTVKYMRKAMNMRGDTINENYIDHTLLYLRLRNNADYRFRNWIFLAGLHNGIGDILYRQELSKGGDERSFNGIRAKIRRVCADLCAPVPPPKGKWAPDVGAKIPDHKFTDTAADCPIPHGLRSRQKGQKKRRDRGFNPTAFRALGGNLKDGSIKIKIEEVK